MKLIVAHSRTKRLIEGPFELCGSEADFEWLVHCIRQQIHGLGYGWITIHEPPSPLLPNTEPVGWDS